MTFAGGNLFLYWSGEGDGQTKMILKCKLFWYKNGMAKMYKLFWVQIFLIGITSIKL